MTEIIERAEVAQLLADPRFLVPEADASASTPFDRFRALASRFANGAAHGARRSRLDAMLAALHPAELAELASARTQEALEHGRDVPFIARQVPVAALAAALGFSEPDRLPPLVAEVTGRYASGTATDAAAEDAAIEHLLAAAPPAADDEGRVLSVQLLVQAHAATAALVVGAMRLEASVIPQPSTRELLHTTLREESPVPLTRRTAPDGTLLVLRLDGPDAEAEARGVEPRTLAFGAGPRGCPAPHHTLAIAAAIVDELRRALPGATASATRPSNTEETFHADAR